MRSTYLWGSKGTARIVSSMTAQVQLESGEARTVTRNIGPCQNAKTTSAEPQNPAIDHALPVAGWFTPRRTLDSTYSTYVDHQAPFRGSEGCSRGLLCPGDARHRGSMIHPRLPPMSEASKYRYLLRGCSLRR